jgi:proteasome accessory factor B
VPKKGRAGRTTKAVPQGARAPKKGTARPVAASPSGRDDRPKRLLDLVVMLLGSRSPVPYRELKSQFRAYRKENEEAGLRAFERDKADLLELGVPLKYVTPEEDNSIEEAGYVVDLRRYRLPEIHLTSDEVAALVLAGSVARAAPGTSYAEVVDLALKKLAFDLPQPPDTPGSPIAAAKKPREPVLVHFPRPADAAALAERLAVLEQATRNRKRVTLLYVTASSGQAATRDVDPFGLVYRQGTWLLVGHCHLRLGVRTFRLDRIMEVQVAPKPKSPDFERPAGFDVRRYAARSPWTFDIEPPLAVELLVQPDARAVENEDFGAEARREALPGGGVRLRFPSGNPDYVIARVVAAKGGLILAGPPALRERVRHELQAITALYGEAR